MKKHAIVLHLYYNDLWQEFKEKLTPILQRGDVDLYVTMTNEDMWAKDEVEKLTPYVYIVENRGLDIGPFIYILDKIKDKTYQSIIKLHSKKSLHHGNPVEFGESWRNYLLEYLIGSRETYDKNIDLINRIPLAMVSCPDYLFDFNRDGINIPHHYSVIHETIERLQLKIEETVKNNSICFAKSGRFFAGTMFATSHQYFKDLFQNIDMLEFYKSLPEGYSRNSSAHALERIFGYYLEQSGGEFYSI